MTRREILAAGVKSAAALSFFGSTAWAMKPAVFGSRSSAPSHVPGLGNISGARSLKAHAEPQSLLFGCGVEVDRLRHEPGYAELVTSQCDIIAAENDMKWNALRPQPGAYNFDTADWLIGFCEKNKMKLRGHVLVWHQALPSWFQNVVTRQNARQVLVDHIQQVMGRYAGRMHSWDVVNEVVDLASGRVDSLRNSPWLQLAGDDYIELAFRTARDADPTTLLTYNEYGIELETQEHEEKRAMVLLLLRRLKARQAPVDALGIQSHLAAVSTQGSAKGSYGPGLQRFIATVRQMDMQVFLTEMDVNDKALPAPDSQRDQIVAATYADYLNRVLTDRAVTVALTWGLTDRYSWMNQMPGPNRADKLPSRPLPFDAGYRPKEAFLAMRDCFDRRRLGAPSQIQPVQSDPASPFNPQPYLPSEPVRY